MENFTRSLETILIQRQWNPGCHSAEPPSENDCSYVASGETPCHVMAPVTMEKELSMRSIKWLGLILTAVSLLFCGCGGGHSPVLPSAALGTQLHYRHGGLHQGDGDHAEQPHQQRRSGDLVQCEPGPSGGPEPERQHGHHQWNPHGRDRHGQLHGNGFQLGRQHHGDPDHHGE